jgi:hypothetical protein
LNQQGRGREMNQARRNFHPRLFNLYMETDHLYCIQSKPKLASVAGVGIPVLTSQPMAS